MPTMLNRHEAGFITYSDPGADKPLLEVGTIQCVHCGRHWVPRPGSGTVRGYCTRCMGPVCGAGCAACVPVDLYLTNIEQGRPEGFVPVVVPVSFSGSE